MKINYRKVCIDDAYGYEMVSAYSWYDTYYDMLPHDMLEERVDRLNNPSELNKKILTINEHILNKSDNIFVAYDEDLMVGFVEVGNSRVENSGYGYLGALYVLSEYHNQGIGSQLFKLGVMRLIEMGYSKMELLCMEKNPALNFYKKYGGVVSDKIDYPIYGINVKADVVLFENIKDIIK